MTLDTQSAIHPCLVFSLKFREQQSKTLFVEIKLQSLFNGLISSKSLYIDYIKIVLILFRAFSDW